MEPTKVKRGLGKDILLEPAHKKPAPEEYQRSPTLMVGEEAGTGGAVKVWAPDRQMMWVGAITVGGILLLSLTIEIVTGRWGLWMASVFVIPLILALRTAIRRPCYLTTDDRGIGITTETGSRALRWSEIQSVEEADNKLRILVLGMDIVEIYLTGYPKAARKQLLEMITRRADLQRDPEKRNLFLR